MILPLVSIVIPTYNRGSLLSKTLMSVLIQEYQNWECLVVDDGSSDNTSEIMQDYCDKDFRFKYFLRPKFKPKGASTCRNIGLRNAIGDLFQFLDSDDLLDSQKLKEQVGAYLNCSKSTLITGKWGGFVDPDDLNSLFKYKSHCYRSFSSPIKLLETMGKYNEFFPLHVYLTPKILIERAGPWNETLTNNDDGEFFTRVILESSHIKFTCNAHVYYRYNSNNKLSGFNSKLKLLSAMKSWDMIDKYIRNKFPGRESLYVKRGKENIKHEIKIRFPEIIVEHKEFFDEEESCGFLFKLRRYWTKFID